MRPRKILAAVLVVALIAVMLYLAKHSISQNPSDDSGTAIGESWICTTVIEPDYLPPLPFRSIEGPTLHLEARMVLEQRVYELGFYQYSLSYNVGPIYLQEKSGERLVLSAGQRSPIPRGFGAWQMTDWISANSSEEYTPTLQLIYSDADGELGWISIEIGVGTGHVSHAFTGSNWGLDLADCAFTQVTVPTFRPAQTAN